MRFGSILSSVLLTTTIAIFPLNGIAALSRQEVYAIAQKITVRIDGTKPGSGIIIKRKINSQGSTYTYTVLTNWHVVDLEGKYTVTIYNGGQYTFNHRQVKQLGDVDLAEFTFTSSQYYQEAEMGDSDTIAGGETIYVGGFPELAQGLTERKFDFNPGSITGPPQKPNINGYTLRLDTKVIKGKSGGTILDENGKLVGIYGQSSRNINNPGTDTIPLGIPLKTYLQLTGTRINLRTSVTKQPAQQPITPQHVRTTQPPNTPKINVSSVGMDYTQLQDLLARGKWKEADEETGEVMLIVVNREKEGWLDRESVEKFPCEDLRTIDQLWVKYSSGHFGFSVQKGIYQNFGGKKQYNWELWNKFGDRVGWKKIDDEGKQQWLSYSDFIFDIEAPKGHLPYGYKVWGDVLTEEEWLVTVYRLQACKL